MTSSKRFRVGAVSYLNTKPLVYGLAEFAPEIELEYDLPSRLADGLAAGRLDVALIPSIEYLRRESYSIVSDACIACRGPVLSVKLLSRVPMQEIQSLALDEGSRTSAALVRILLERRFGQVPRFATLPIGADPEDCSEDAVLLIGDRAIHPPGGFLEEWDLGDQWCRWAGLPFVFAMWVARPGVDAGALASSLAVARDAGCAHLEAIAREQAATVGLTPQQCLAYLRDNLHFYLGPHEQRGLETFGQHAIRLSIVPERLHQELLRQ